MPSGRRLQALEDRVALLRGPAPASGAAEASDALGDSILAALGLFGGLFAGESWAAWRVFLRALFALALDPAELDVYRRHTERSAAPGAPSREAWVIVGRRGGKSRIAALVAVFLACFRDYRGVLAPGETGVVMVLAADRTQARIVFRYICGLLDTAPELGSLVAKRLKESVTLTTGVVIEVHTASFKKVRGHTVLGAVLDEVAFWPTDETGANPDTAIVGALRPAMATVPGALLLAISTPYARRGEVWNAYHRWWRSEAPGAPLVWQAETAAMNPAVDPEVIARAYADDPVAAAAEYGAQFRSDVEGFLALDAVQAAVVPGRRELAPQGEWSYVAFTDPSGGSQDAFTIAIAHREEGRAVLDCVREVKPPFSPDAVCAEFAELLVTYGLAEVTGDHYAGLWPTERFAAHGVRYQPAAEPKSALYQRLLPAVNSGRVALLDSPRLLAQLVGLERRVARSGRDSIDHAPGGHDDVANAVAGALGLALPDGELEPGMLTWIRQQVAQLEEERPPGGFQLRVPGGASAAGTSLPPHE